MKVKNIKKKTGLFAAILFSASTNVIAQVFGTIELTNPAALSRPDELISIKRAVIAKQLNSSPEFVTISYDGKQLPVQYVDENRDSKWDEVIFLYSFKPNEKASFKLFPAARIHRADTGQRAHVRLRKKNRDDTFGPGIISETMPLRNPATDFSKQALPMYLTEGPAWENDKVAYRLYLDVRNNKDIYGKTTSEMMMDTVGVNHKVSYHTLADWGMDVLHVVKSLGAGALALSVPQKGAEDTLIRLGGLNITKTVYQQVADGPLLARFTITYDWQINYQTVQVKEEINVWGGQYFYESKLTVAGAPKGSQLVTGIADFYENTFETINQGNAVIAFSYGKQSENKDNLGLGVLVNKQNFAKVDSINRSNTDINETYIIAQTISGETPLYYRFYAGWERTDKRFTTFKGFKDFLREEGIRYSKPINIKWKRI